ncbi:MAG: hypothetical protein V2I43_24395 [Parvularcula sp.]|jgi:hypothetical protein|nr:hypothetical protein [Parvularcula sp.]
MVFISFVASFLMFQSAAAQPSCDTEPYRQFDFWIGTWDVFNAQDEVIGRNTITAEEDGCLLVERWTGASGNTGQSYNFYDPADQTWRQLWVARGFIIDYRGGLDAKAHMVLEGMMTPRNGSGPLPFKGRWMPLEDGSVQQTFWTENGETGTWELAFDANYRPVPL